VYGTKGNLNEIYEITYAAFTKTSSAEGSGVEMSFTWFGLSWLGVLKDPPEETPAKQLKSDSTHIEADAAAAATAADAACCTCVECMQHAASTVRRTASGYMVMRKSPGGVY